MLKNTSGKELTTFEREMEYHILYLGVGLDSGHIESEYVSGMKRGYEYALALYRESMDTEEGTI